MAGLEQGSVPEPEHGQLDDQFATPDEQAAYYRALREANDAKPSRYVHPGLPQGADELAHALLERVRDAERELVAPNDDEADYEDGTAEYPDHLLREIGITATGRTLLTAEHATVHQRLRHDKTSNEWRRERKGEDFGTAGLGWVLHQDTGSGLLVARGRQTGDANNDNQEGVEHPIKTTMRHMLADPAVDGHFSLHGINRGKGQNITDERGMNLVFGVGNDPSDETLNIADALLEIADNHGLKAGINTPLVTFMKAGGLRRHKGTDDLWPTTLAAAGQGTTRAFAQSVAEGLDKSLATLQVEISNVNRWQPETYGKRMDQHEMALGVYATYLTLRDGLQLLADEAASAPIEQPTR